MARRSITRRPRRGRRRPRRAVPSWRLRTPADVRAWLDALDDPTRWARHRLALPYRNAEGTETAPYPWGISIRTVHPSRHQRRGIGPTLLIAIPRLASQDVLTRLRIGLTTPVSDRLVGRVLDDGPRPGQLDLTPGRRHIEWEE